jgi:VWFA-related protein
MVDHRTTGDTIEAVGKRVMAGVACWVTLSSAPASPVQEAPVFATGVEVVAVDVSVVDKEGRPVRDLVPGDFTLTVGGRPRRVVSAQFISEPGPGQGEAPEEGPDAGLGERPPTDYSTNENAHTGRLVLIAVDQGNIPAGGGRATIAAAEKLLDRLGPIDQVGLLTLPGPEPRVEFTTDRAAIRKALGRVVGRGRLAGRRVSLTEALACTSGDDPERCSSAVARECGSDIPCQQMLRTEAASVASDYKLQSKASLNLLVSAFDVLKTIEGPKTVVLITQGLGEPESGSRAGYGFSSDIRPLGDAAAAARVSLFAVKVGPGFPGAETNQLLESVLEDQSLQEYGLETLVTVARGVVLRGSPEKAFERIAREISGHYLLGFEPEAGERDGKNHDLRLKVARPGVTVRTWRSVSIPPPPSPKQEEQALVASLWAPQPASALPMRVASYALRDSGSGKVKVLIAAELGRGGMPAGLSVAYVLVDEKKKVVASAAQRATGGAGSTAVSYVTSVVVEPGLYTLKLAARDRSGRLGRVDHPVKAAVTSTAGGEVEMSDLVLGAPPSAGAPFRPSAGLELAGGALVAHLELYTRDRGRLDEVGVNVEIAADETAPAVRTVPTRSPPAATPGRRVVQALVPVADLPPGRYVVRATVSLAGRAIGTMTRPFRLANTRSLGLLQERGRPVDLGGKAFQGAGGDHRLLLGRLPVAQLQRLAHSGQGLDAVARVVPGRVDVVAEPGTAGQALRTRERLLGVHQKLVDGPLRLR